MKLISTYSKVDSLNSRQFPSTYLQSKALASLVSLATELILLALVVLSLAAPSGAQDILEVGFDLVEDQPPGAYVGNVLLSADLDKIYSSEVLRRLQFRFMRQHSVGFEIDANTGIIRTSAVVDRDSQCPGSLTCSVRIDVGIQPVEYFRLIRATVSIIDVNDHAPGFPPPRRRTIELSESSAVGTVIPLPGAKDPDGPAYSVRHYGLQMNPQSDNFVLEADGRQLEDGSQPGLKLILVKNLDRESVSEYHLTVTAFDGDDPPRTGTLDVRLKVTDSNDNSPVFDRDRYELTIPENLPPRSPILQVSATDPDSGENARIVYSLSPFTANAYGHIFGIDADTGRIYAKGTVDHESSSVYRLVVVAQDRGPDPVAASVAVVLTVEDANDNAPEIAYDSMSDSVDGTEAEVREDAVAGTFVAHLTVTDRDGGGDNGRFNCSLVVDDGHFQLRSLTETEFQIYLASPVDREVQSSYNLTVECADFGVPPRSSSQNIVVQVTDVNDWEPTFTQRTYRTELIENNYVGASVVQVSAQDRDRGRNSEIVYTLDSNAADSLRIDPSSGLITSLVSYDRESVDGMTFQVFAADQGVPSRSTSARVVLTIADVNDNRPTFQFPFYSFGIYENEAPESKVGVVVAMDNDSGPNGEVSYGIAPGPSSSLFRISESTGVVSAVVALDREETTVHYLKVTAFDAGEPPLTGTVGVTVTVADVNDNRPKFEYPTAHNDSVHVSTLAPAGYEVARVRAYDIDSGHNARLSFGISNESATERETPFRIGNRTGIVTVDADLAHLDGRRFDLKIAACDAGAPAPRCAGAHLRVHVNRSVPLVTSDRSDGLPVFAGRRLAVVVAFAAVCGVLTTVLIATVVIARRRKVMKYENNYNCRTAALRMFPAQSSASVAGVGEGAVGAGNGGKCLAFLSPEADGKTTKRPRSPTEQEEGRRDELNSSTKKLLQAIQHNSEWSVNSRYRDSTNSDPKVQPLLPPASKKIHAPNDDEDRNYFQLCHSEAEKRRGESGSPKTLPVAADSGSKSSEKNQNEKEVSHLLDILKQDSDARSVCSAEVSNEDSGRGPCEEGGGGGANNPQKKSILHNPGTRASEAEGNESSSFVAGKWSQPLATNPKTRTLCGPHSCLKGSPSHKPAQVHPRHPKTTCVPNLPQVPDERSPVRQLQPNDAIRPSTRQHDISEFPPPPTSHVVEISPGNSVHSRRHQFQQPAADAAADVIYGPTYANGRPQFDHAVNSFKGGYAGSLRRDTQPDYFHGKAAAAATAASWSRRHHPPSRGWEDDDGDDGGATTTSGSYVVDPKELCEDIDELFFRDDRKEL